MSLLSYSFKGLVHFDNVLSFGFRSATFLCQRVSSNIKFIRGVMNVSIEDYLDYLAGAEIPKKVWKSFSELGNVLHFCGLKEFEGKAYIPSTQMTFISVHFDSISLTLSVTENWLSEILRSDEDQKMRLLSSDYSH